jgi:hypothetical protein
MIRFGVRTSLPLFEIFTAHYTTTIMYLKSVGPRENKNTNMGVNVTNVPVENQ